MSASQIVGYVVVPLIIFVLGSAGGGITLLVKFVGYTARSQAAQEDTAKATTQIATDLRGFMQRTDSTLLRHATELAVHESQIDALQNGRRGHA